MLNLRTPLRDDALAALRQRNAERLRIAIARLGTRYLLHPSRRVQRIADAPPPINPPKLV